MASAHSANPVTSKADDKSCCFWVKHSKACIKISAAVVTIVAAVALAAVVVGVLLVLANQGIQLGGFNFLAEMIEAKWVYLGLGLATAVLLADAIAIVVLVRAHLNRTFFEKTVKKLGIEDDINNQHIADRMDPKTYWVETRDAKQGTADQENAPAIYTIVVKNEKGVDLTSFKTQQELTHHIKNLGSDYHDAKKAFNDALEYPLSYLQARFDDATFQSLQKLGDGLEDGYYRRQDFDTPVDVAVVAAAKNKEVHLHYYKKDKVTEELNKNYSDLLDETAFDATVNEDSEKLVISKLKPKQYWPFNSIFGATPFYAVSYVPEGKTECKTLSFRKPDECDEYIKSNFKPEDHWEDARKAFEERKIYTLDEVRKLIERDISSFTERLSLFDNEYYLERLVENGLTIYAIAVKKKGSELERFYYKKEEDAAKHDIKGLINRREVEEQIYGPTGHIKKEMMESRVKQVNEYLPIICTSNKTPVYGVVFRMNLEDDYKKAFGFCYWLKEKEREEQTKDTGRFPAKNNVSIREAQAEGLQDLNAKIKASITKYKLDKLPIDDFVYVKEKYKIDGKETVALLFKESGTFNSPKTYANDAACEKFLKSSEGKAFTPLSSIFSEAFLCVYDNGFVQKEVDLDLLKIVQTKKDKLKDKELIIYDIPSKDKKRVFYTLGFCTETGIFSSEKKVIYFASKEARDTYIKANLQGFSDVDAWHRAEHGPPLGMLGEQGVETKFHLDELLHYQGDTFTYEFEDVWGVKSYVSRTAAIIGAFGQSAKNVDERNITLSLLHKTTKKPLYRDLTNSIKEINHAALTETINKFKAKHIDKILEDKDYWLEQGVIVGDKKMDFLYFKDRVFRLCVFESGSQGAEKMIKEKGLKDAKKVFEDSVEYPQRLGEFLINKAAWTKEDFERLKPNILNNEYWGRINGVTQDAQYPGIAQLALRDSKGEVTYRYFKTDKRLTDCTDKLESNHPNSSAYKRQTDCENYAKMMADIVNAATEPKKSFFWVREHKESDKSHLITVTFNAAEGKWKAESFYNTPANIRSQVTTTLKGYIDLKDKTVGPLSVEENALIEKNEKNQVIKEWDSKLPAHHFVKLFGTYYTALLVRNEEKDAIVSTEYRCFDYASIAKHINSLQATHKPFKESSP